MTDIVTLIEHANHIIANVNVNSHVSTYNSKPKHLLYDIRRITHQYREHNSISQEDMDYLQQLYVSTTEFLLDHAFILGEWYAYKSHKYKNYNIKRGTTPSKVSGFINYR